MRAAAEETTTSAAGEPTTTAMSIDGTGRNIGMAFDVGGRGDLSFNDLAALAWDEAKANLRLSTARSWHLTQVVRTASRTFGSLPNRDLS